MSRIDVNTVLGNPATALAPGRTRRLIHTSTLMSVVLEIDNGPWAAADPYHVHPHEQTTYVAAGELDFLVEGEAPRRLIAGDLVAIPGNVPHSIWVHSERAILVDNFTPIRQDFLG
jgi:uncharacterized RmlC-like cupin family protein